jgi:hypothetical protein
MGCAIVKAAKVRRDDDSAVDWSVGSYYAHGSRSIYEAGQAVHTVQLDSSIPALEDPDHIQLYELLHEPLAQTLLGSHAQSNEGDRSALLMCWAEIEEFKNENVDTMLLIRAVDIFEHFIKSGTKHCLPGLPADEVSRYDTLITQHTVAGSHVQKNIFAEVS